LELCDVVWRWVIFFEAKRVQVFLAVQVFLGSSKHLKREHVSPQIGMNPILEWGLPDLEY
jgi:hypothetical protein